MEYASMQIRKLSNTKRIPDLQTHLERDKPEDRTADELRRRMRMLELKYGKWVPIPRR